MSISEQILNKYFSSVLDIDCDWSNCSETSDFDPSLTFIMWNQLFLLNHSTLLSCTTGVILQSRFPYTIVLGVLCHLVY